MPTLEIVFNLAKLYGWRVLEMEDSGGDKCLHLCIPMDANGIYLNKRKRPNWIFKVVKNLFCVPTLTQQARERLIQRGALDPTDKRPTTVLGTIRKVKI